MLSYNSYPIDYSHKKEIDSVRSRALEMRGFSKVSFTPGECNSKFI